MFLEIIHTFRIVVTGQAVLPSVISRRVIHRLDTRRLRTAVAITAKRNALEYAVIARRTVSVVIHRTAVTRSAIVSAAAAAAATAMARSATRTTAGVVLTSARIARNDITASVTAHTLITAVPVTASLDCIHRISRSIYAVRITVPSSACIPLTSCHVKSKVAQQQQNNINNKDFFIIEYTFELFIVQTPLI